MNDLFELIARTYGIAGFIIISPFIGLVAMYKQNIRLQGEVVKATKENVESQKQRVKDAQDINTKLLEVIREQSSLNTETNLGLERIGDALNAIQSRFPEQRR